MEELMRIWIALTIATLTLGAEALADTNLNTPPPPEAATSPAAEEACIAPAVSAIDPLRSGVTPGALPEFTPPQLDIVGGSLQYNVDGAALNAVVAPAAIGTSSWIPVISDLRVQLYARDKFQRLGGALLAGWDSASAKLNDAKVEPAGPCTSARERALQQARFEAAYRNRFVIGVRGGAEMLPMLSGPKVLDPTSQAYVDSEPNRFGGYTAVFHFGWYSSRQLGFFVTGGVAGSRAVRGVRGVNLRAGGGADLAYQLAVGSLRSDGFQPGFTFGAFFRGAGCVSDGGCDQDVHGYDTPIAFDFAMSSGAYIDARLSNLVQLRLAVPTNYYGLHSAPANSIGGANIVEVAPTVVLSVASWGL
jgi:hypothetical protein